MDCPDHIKILMRSSFIFTLLNIFFCPLWCINVRFPLLFCYNCTKQYSPWRSFLRIASTCQGPLVCSFVASGQPSGKLGVSYACRWSCLTASIILTRPLRCWKLQVWWVTKSNDGDKKEEALVHVGSQSATPHLCFFVSRVKKKKILNIRPLKSVKLVPQSHCNSIQVGSLWLPVESGGHSEGQTLFHPWK